MDKRSLEWDDRSSVMPSRDKLCVVVDAFGRWRINNPTQYFTRMRDERTALSRWDDIIGSELRNAVAKNDLIELVRTTIDRQPVLDPTATTNAAAVGESAIRSARKMIGNGIPAAKLVSLIWEMQTAQVSSWFQRALLGSLFMRFPRAQFFASAYSSERFLIPSPDILCSFGIFQTQWSILVA